MDYYVVVSNLMGCCGFFGVGRIGEYCDVVVGCGEFVRC